MKKTMLTCFALIMALGLSTSSVKAQATFTTDLEIIFRDTTRYFELEAFNDSVQVDFAIVNHGGEDVDTNGYILYGLPDLPAGWALVVNALDGGATSIAVGDTLDASGVLFSQAGAFSVDTTIRICYFLMTNEDSDEFIFDPNQYNDTVCFFMTYKKNDSLTAINEFAKIESLNISPNPASDYVNIPVKDLGNRQAALRIFAVDGRLAHEQTLEPSVGDMLRIDVSTWPKGVYIVDLHTDKSKRVGRFVVR